MAVSTIKAITAGAKEWTLKGTATGKTAITMPTDFNEILLVGKMGAYYWTSVVPKDEISDTAILPRSASYYNASANAFITWRVTTSTAILELCSENSGTDKSSATTVKLYYR